MTNKHENVYKTGWFGIPGDTTGMYSTKTHMVNAAKQPICGSLLREDQEFQVCSSYVHKSWVECKKCLSIIEKLENQK